MSINLTNRTIDFLRDHKDIKFTARDIANALNEQFLEQFKMKKERSSSLQSDEDLIQQIVAEIGASRPRIQKKCPQIETSDDRPRKYFYSSEPKNTDCLLEKDLKTPIEPTEALTASLEHELYPKLSLYLKSEHQTWSKRVDEKRASNSSGAGANKWLFPDVVAFEDFSSEWDREVKNCAQNCKERQCRLWSFEVKKRITRSNVRESFFQAVSNSTWSHLGYLVAEKIEGDGTLKELRILSARHGIGIIKLNFANPTEESDLLIPAQFRPELDWNHINRLTIENRDFRDFIRNVRHFHQTGDVRPKDWDVEGFD